MSGYIGTQPVPQATQTRDSFTATSGQTTFATGGYTPNFLDVYLNGVKLASADYTATNGSDVVLASGAATGDILEVVAFTTFTVGSSFTPSIDDNGNATAITIDSSEHVLVGTTDSAVWNDTTGTGGINLRSDGILAAARNGGEPLLLNRLGTDGELIKFNKDGTTVGSIGVNSGDQVYFAASDGMGIKVDTDNTSVEASNAAGSDNDNAVNLGSSGTRWKDLYLSGGIYLGGTGSANKLDDYEEGTWTPTLITGTVSTSYGFYTKIGNTVIVRMEYGNFSNTTANSNIEVNNLPFTSSSVSSSGATGSVFIRYSNRIPNATYVGNNGTRTVMWESSSGSYTTVKHADLNSSTAFIYAQVIYEAT